MSSTTILSRIWVLMVTVFVDMMGFLMILPLLPFYAERLGADPFLIGILVSSFAVAQLASAPLWGRFSDRFGRRPALLVGLTASALAYLLFAVADSFWILLLSRVVQGAGGGTTAVAQAYVSDVVPPEDRTRALGWLSAATSFGVMIGPGLGSLAAGLGAAAPGLLAALVCVVNVGFAARVLPESKAGSRGEASDRAPVGRMVGQVLRRPLSGAHPLIWIYALGMMAFMGMNGILALFLERRFAFTEHSIGFFYVWVGALSVVMRALLLGPVLRWFGEVRVMKLGALSLIAGFVGLPLTPNRAALAAVVVLIPVGTALLFPATSSMVSRHARGGEIGQLLGVQQAFGGVARMIGPVWAGAAFQYISWEAPFFLSAVVTGLVLIVASSCVRPPSFASAAAEA